MATAKLLYRRLDALFGSLKTRRSQSKLVETFLEEALANLKDDLRLRGGLVYVERRDNFALLKATGDVGAPVAETLDPALTPLTELETYADLLRSKARLLTSDFVLSETYTLIRFKVGHHAAVEFMKRLDQTGITALRVSEANEQTAKAIFVRYTDKDFSFVDCTSFALIDQHRLDHVFAFDSHFRQYRFKRNVVVLPQELA